MAGKCKTCTSEFREESAWVRDYQKKQAEFLSKAAALFVAHSAAEER